MTTQTLTQLWNLQISRRPRRGLPSASPEQKAIVEAVRGGCCVRITAFAGTGKTSTALIVVCDDDKSNTIITYNRALADETNAAIRRLGITNVICYTYHARVGIAAGLRGKVNNDAKLLTIVDQWDRGLPVHEPIVTDRVIIDEVQDMRPSFYRAVVHMLAPARQLLVLGDENQMLYDYGKDDAAHAGFLLRAHEYFASTTLGRTWVSLNLSTSYRLTPKIATFVNLLWGTNIKAGNFASDLPVEYWCLNMYDAKLRQRLRGVIEENQADDVALLSPMNLISADGKERPMQTIINHLLMEKHPSGKRCYNFATKENGGAAGYKNKIRAWTHNASKGSTIKTTIVFGFSAYKGQQPKKNQLGVAISRSNHRLIVVHECDKNGPNPYCEPFNHDLLSQLVEEGVVVAPDGVPTDYMDTPDALEPETIAVTGITHLSACTVQRLLRYGTDVERIEPQYSIDLQLTHTFHTGLHKTEEDVSSIYGVAIPFALECERTGSILLIESMLSNPIIVNASKLYTADEVIALLKEVKNLTLEETNGIRATFRRVKSRGSFVIDALRDLRRRYKSLNNICVCERRHFDKIFNDHHQQCVQDIYYRTEKQAVDFMYLANAFIAVEGTHELFVQIGNDYTWVNDDAFKRAVVILMEEIPLGEHERNICAAVEPPIHGHRRIASGIAGCLDVKVNDTTAYELKFVRDLSLEHELQTLLYAAILAIISSVPSSCTLFNARSGEKIVKEIDPEHARMLVREAVLAKLDG